VVAPRRAYAHHGIYAGQGRVLQYGGGLRRAPVEEVSLRGFSHGRQIWIRLGELGWRDRPEVVHRARSRLGEDRYHVLRNNCEHFCEWCASGQHRSYQVEALVGRVGEGWLLFVESFARVFAEKRRHVTVRNQLRERTNVRESSRLRTHGWSAELSLQS
jgi:ribosomal protein L37E